MLKHEILTSEADNQKKSSQSLAKPTQANIAITATNYYDNHSWTCLTDYDFILWRNSI